MSYQPKQNKKSPYQIVPLKEVECELSDGAFRTLLVIRSFCISSEYCWPSLKVLAEKRGTSARTIRRNLAELEKKDYITIERLNGAISIYIPKDLHRAVDKNGHGSVNNGKTVDKNGQKPWTKMAAYNRRRIKKEEIGERSALGQQRPPEMSEPSPDEIERVRILKEEFLERSTNGTQHPNIDRKREHPDSNTAL